jgi:hypothetical protein
MAGSLFWSRVRSATSQISDLYRFEYAVFEMADFRTEGLLVLWCDGDIALV